MTVPVILNPMAGGGRLLRHRPELDSTARSMGVSLKWWPTEGKGDGERLASEAAHQGHPLVLAFGGDGTYNEVARGLAGSATVMGVLPGGTTSVLAYELDVPRPGPKALESLLTGVDRSMRMGRTDRGDVVLLMLSSGPDAVIVRDAFARRRRNDGKLGIARQAIRELVGRRPLPRLRLRAGDRVVEAGWIVAGNARCYGGPVRATPGADPFEPGFEVVAHLGTGRRSATSFGLALLLGRHVRRRDVVRIRCDRVIVEPIPAEAELPYQVDGDPIMKLPVTLEVDPRPLLVRLPAKE